MKKPFVAGLILSLMVVNSFGQTNESTNSAIEKRVAAVAALNGDEYRRGRLDLAAICATNRACFEYIRTNSFAWEVRLLSGIVSERVAKAPERAAFLKWRLSWQHVRGWKRNMLNCAQAIAEKGTNVPTLFVEHFWKGNELADWENANEYPFEKWGFQGLVLGLLNVRDSSYLLDNALTNSLAVPKNIAGDGELMAGERASIAWGISLIRDPSSVPAIVKSLEDHKKQDDKSHYELYGGELAEALVRCADATSLPFLKEKLQTIKNEELRMEIEWVVNQFEKPESVSTDSHSVRK